MSDPRKPVVIAIALVALSCTDRLPVELIESEGTNELQIALLSSGEGTLAESTVDSTGLLHEDEEQYPATFVVAGVQTRSESQSTTFTYSRVLLNDRSRPVEIQGQFVGYVGMDVGLVHVNGMAIPQRTRTFTPPAGPPLPVPVTLGVFYDASGFVLNPGSDVTFSISGGDSLPPATIVVRSPSSVTVTSVEPHSMVSRRQDLAIQWSGQGADEVRLLISGETPDGPVPVLRLRAANPGKPFTVPSKVLRLLPEGVYSRFLFSLISLNRVETTIPGYPDPVLVQAASIHNISVNVQP